MAGRSGEHPVCLLGLGFLQYEVKDTLSLPSPVSKVSYFHSFCPQGQEARYPPRHIFALTGARICLLDAYPSTLAGPPCSCPGRMGILLDLQLMATPLSDLRWKPPTPRGLGGWAFKTAPLPRQHCHPAEPQPGLNAALFAS